MALYLHFFAGFLAIKIENPSFPKKKSSNKHSCDIPFEKLISCHILSHQRNLPIWIKLFSPFFFIQLCFMHHDEERMKIGEKKFKEDDLHTICTNDEIITKEFLYSFPEIIIFSIKILFFFVIFLWMFLHAFCELELFNFLCWYLLRSCIRNVEMK